MGAEYGPRENFRWEDIEERRVSRGESVPERSNGDFVAESGGEGRGVGEGVIRELNSGRCICFATRKAVVPDRNSFNSRIENGKLRIAV